MNRKRIALNIIGFFLIIVGYSYFRSYIDQIGFVFALDKVISIIISEIWKVLSSPTIFIATLIVLLLISFRENLLKFFPAIKEIKAGSFSAIIDYSQIENLLSAKSNELESAKDLDTKKKKEDVQNYLLERIGKETLTFFLELDGNSNEFSETLKTAERLHLGERYLDDNSLKKLEVISKMVNWRSNPSWERTNGPYRRAMGIGRTFVT